MTAHPVLRAIPVDDRAWLVAALEDALAGGAPILPLSSGVDASDPEIDGLTPSERVHNLTGELQLAEILAKLK